MKIDKYDVVVIITVALKAITIFITVFIIALSSNITKASIETTAQTMEANPLLTFFMSLKTVGAIGAVLIIPAAMLAVYHVAKKLLIKQPIVLQFLVWVLFYSVFFNFIHDFGTLAGLLVRWGVI